MAYSLQQVVSDGSLNRITVSIDYIDKSNISLFVDDILLPDGTYTWVWDGGDVVITPNVANASVVVVKRNTKFDLPYHDFSAGAVFKDSSIDENFRQMLFIAQEAAEGATATDFYQDLNFHGYRLTKVGNAVEPDDAIPYSQYIADALGAGQFRLLAEAAANAADVSEASAASSASAASASASAASTSASTAITQATNASNSATAAAGSASASSTSAANAANSATTASTSASNAAASAAAAAASAASINDANLVHKTGNETVGGIKTFTSPVGVPTGTAAGDAVNKAQLDTKVGLAGDETVAGVKTFSSSPVLPGNATTALQAVPKQQLDAAVAGLATPSAVFDVFTASGTWVCPAGVTSVRVCLVGGGGGGSGAASGSGRHGGGGGVGYAVVAVTPGNSYPITVGAGGNGSNSTTGTVGGNTTGFGITANGGGVSSTSGTAGVDGTVTGASITTHAGMLRTPPPILGDGVLGGNSYRRAANDGLTNVAFSLTSRRSVGLGGWGETDPNNDASGGVGGAVLIWT